MFTAPAARYCRRLQKEYVIGIVHYISYRTYYIVSLVTTISANSSKSCKIPVVHYNSVHDFPCVLPVLCGMTQPRGNKKAEAFTALVLNLSNVVVAYGMEETSTSLP